MLSSGSSTNTTAPDKALRFLSKNMPLYTAGAVIRNRFNPNLIKAWQGALSGLADNIAMIALILTGAALIRERERGTLEHLLVMPVTPLEIMLSKVWSMTLVVLVSSFTALVAVIHHSIGVPMTGSVTLFMFGILLSLFTVTSLGIFLACFAKDMPQLGILIILVLLPMQILSGGMTPQSSMPEAVQFIMKFAPTTYIVQLSKAIVLRGAGFTMLWDVYLEMLLLGSLYFFVALKRFRRTVAG